MKLWRGQTGDPSRPLLTARDKAIGNVVFGLLCLAMAVAKLIAAQPQCSMSKRYLCRIVHFVADASGLSISGAEVSLLGAFGLALICLGAVYWRAG